MPVGYTDIVGKFTRAVVDGPDSDRDPDRIPIEGLQFEFVVDLKPAVAKDTAAKETVYLDPIPATTDANGVLIGPDGLPGIRLTASDSPDLDPNGWTYTVTTKGAGLPTLKTTFVTESGKTLDFSDIIAVPPSPGNQIPAWTAVVSQATSAAAVATEAKEEAIAAAESVQRDQPNGVAPIGADKKIPEPNLPTRLSEAGLSATIVGETGYDLVLLLGQSNVSGRGTPYDIVRFDSSDFRISQFGSSGTYGGIESIAVEPLAMHDTPSGIGPGLAFARWYLQGIPTGRRVMLVPAAHGGTRLSTGASPLGWRRGVAGNLYDQALAQAQAALATAGPNSRIVAALWIQGESDGDSNTTGAAYEADLDALITGLRSDLSIPGLPFIIGQMVPEYLSTGTRAQIDAVHAATPSRLANTAFAHGVAGESLNDGSHYNAVAQRTMGRRMYDALRRVLTGAAQPPLPAKAVKVTGVTTTPTNTSVAVAWVAAAGADAYAVDYRATGSSTWLRAATVKGLTRTITSLTTLTGYEVRVTGVNAAGLGTPSDTITFTSGDVPDVIDSFNRADNATSLGVTDSGQTWQTDASVWGIVGNRASMISGSNGRAFVETARSDGAVQATLAVLGAGASHARLLFRGTGDTNFWFVQHRLNSGVPGKYQLYKSVNGGLSQVGTDSVADGAAGDVVKVVLSGNNIEVRVNGAVVISATDAFNASGKFHGFAAVAAGPRWDDFSVKAA